MLRVDSMEENTHVVHDERGQKFIVVIGGEDCIMAYTEKKDFI